MSNISHAIQKSANKLAVAVQAMSWIHQSWLQEMWDAGSEHTRGAEIESRKSTETKDLYMKLIATNSMDKQCLT